MTESGIDYEITFLCRQIHFLQAGRRCELCNDPVYEQGSELSRPHMHHYFFGPGIPWWFRHNPAYFVCLDHKCHQVNIDAPHKDNHAFRRRFLIKIRRVNPINWFTLKEAEADLRDVKVGLKIVTGPTIDQKKKLLRQLRAELKQTESTAWMDPEACQIGPGMI